MQIEAFNDKSHVSVFRCFTPVHSTIAKALD